MNSHITHKDSESADPACRGSASEEKLPAARGKKLLSYYKQQGARSKKQERKKQLQAASGKKQEARSQEARRRRKRRRSRRRRRRRRSLKFEGCIVDLELVHYQQQGARSYYKQQGARSKKQERKKQLLAARGKKQERKNTRSNYKARGKKSGCKKKKKKLEGCNLDLGLAHYQQQGARSYNKKQSFGAWAVMLEYIVSCGFRKRCWARPAAGRRRHPSFTPMVLQCGEGVRFESLGSHVGASFLWLQKATWCAWCLMLRFLQRACPCRGQRVCILRCSHFLNSRRTSSRIISCCCRLAPFSQWHQALVGTPGYTTDQCQGRASIAYLGAILAAGVTVFNFTAVAIFCNSIQLLVVCD